MKIVLLGTSGTGELREAHSLEEVEELIKEGEAEIVMVGQQPFSSGKFTRDIVMFDKNKLYKVIKAMGDVKVLFIEDKG